MPQTDASIVREFTDIIKDMRYKLSDEMSPDLSNTQNKLQQLISETNNARIVQSNINRLAHELHLRLTKSIEEKNNAIANKLAILEQINTILK
jgi:hypothetical protein